MTRQLLIAGFCVLLAGPSSAGETIRIHRQSLAGFADRETGIKKLTLRDPFVSAMSRFDRQSRLLSDEDVTVEEYLDFVSLHVLQWTDAEILSITEVVQSIEKRFRPFSLSLPEQILFVKTDGKEEGGAAYCRENAVVLPESRIAVSRDRLERLIVHELFHVLSSHNPELRQKLYAIIDFRTCDQISLPGSLSNRKLTNPDAPLVNCVIDLRHHNQNVTVAPVLFANVDRYESRLGGPFFRFLQFRLMVVEQDEAGWIPIEVAGAPVLLDPKKTPGYFKHIGNNTSYIIHPDEILADNFVHLILNTKDLQTPELVEQMRDVLSAADDR
ncbi:MAG: hypothetical protein MK110_10115 [Fuerstiella sp.]|nr:hypothetical protein [Fuerstiella sp.]